MKEKCLIFLVILLSYSPARAQESLLQDLSYPYLDKLIAVAKANYPKVKMFESRIKVAETGITKAKWSYFDIFTLSYLYSPNNTITIVNPSLLNGYQFGVYANIGTLLQKPSMVRQAKEELNVVQYEKETNDLNLEAAVKERYFLYIQQVAIHKLRAQTFLDAESVVKDIKTQYERGERPLDDYNKALIAYSEHNQEVIITEAAMLIAKSNLEELLGKKLEDIK